MKVRVWPKDGPEYAVETAEIDSIALTRLAREHGVALSTEDRKVLRRRVEDALRKRATDGILIRLALELGVNLD